MFRDREHAADDHVLKRCFVPEYSRSMSKHSRDSYMKVVTIKTTNHAEMTNT